MEFKYFFVFDVLCTLVSIDLSGFCATWTSRSANWHSVSSVNWTLGSVEFRW